MFIIFNFKWSFYDTLFYFWAFCFLNFIIVIYTIVICFRPQCSKLCHYFPSKWSFIIRITYLFFFLLGNSFLISQFCNVVVNLSCFFEHYKAFGIQCNIILLFLRILVSFFLIFSIVFPKMTLLINLKKSF